MASLPVPDFDVPALLTRLGARPKRITADSRQVQPGDAFAALPGTRVDGRSFIADALAQGAGAVLWEPQGFAWNREWNTRHFPVEYLRTALGDFAACIYGGPSPAL